MTWWNIGRTIVAVVLLLGVLRSPTTGAGGHNSYRSRNFHPLDMPFAPVTIAVAEHLDRVFVTDAVESTLTVLNATSGAVLHRLQLDKSPLAVAVAQNVNHAFVIYNVNNDITMHDGRTGVVLRTVHLAQQPRAIAADVRNRRVFVVSWILNSLGSGLASHGTISVLDAQTGSTIHSVPVSAKGAAFFTILVDEPTQHVFVAVGTSIIMLDAASGSVLRIITLQRSIPAMLIDDADGHVFVTETAGAIRRGHFIQNGAVIVLDTNTGTVVRTVAVGRISLRLVATAVDQRAHRLFVTSFFDGLVIVLDSRTGRLIKVVPVGLAPEALAVDQKTSHAFLVGLGPQGGVYMLDTRTASLLRRIVLRSLPTVVEVDERTDRTFVANSVTITMLDSRTGNVLQIRALSS